VQVASASESFSMVWITDTQYLSQTWPDYFDNATSWIVKNIDSLNVKMVVHTGDIVNTYSDPTQWEHANHSIGILLDNGIPYCWDAGNHDKNTTTYNTVWMGQDYKAFNVSLMEEKAYWVSDAEDGKNTAVHFDFDNWSFLVVNIEYDANDSVLSWASHLLDDYPKSYCIVATHAYLDGKCQYENNAWVPRFQEEVLNDHSNVFMTLNGHYWLDSCTNHTAVGNRSELMFDYQNFSSAGATLRLLTFNMTEAKIHVKTYNPHTGQFVTDSDNEFTLGIPLALISELPTINLPVLMILFTVVCILSRRKMLTKRFSI
jgi:hypothetical protein